MPPQLGDYLVNLTAELTALVIEAVSRRAGQQMQGTPYEQAVHRCLNAGAVAFIHQAQSHSPAYSDLWQTADTFFHRPDVAKEIARLLLGQPLDVPEIQLLFTEAGYPHPERFDFSAAMYTFHAAFLLQAVQESVLQGSLNASRMLQQTQLQSAQLGVLQEILAVLREVSLRHIVGIQAHTIIAHNVVSGKQENYSLQPTVLPPAYGEKRYLEELIRRCDHLDLTPLSDVRAADSPTLSDVFTTLFLAGVERREQETVAEAIQPRHIQAEKWERVADSQERLPVSAVEAIAALPGLVILGQPGGGKSTLVNHVAAQLAKHRLGQPHTLVDWPADKTPLPLCILLRRFVSWLAKEKRSGDVGDVWDYLAYLFTRWGCTESFQGVRDTLLTSGGMLFFDGLDEIREADSFRPILKRLIPAFAAGLPNCQVVVTSRPYAYEKQVWQLPPNTFPVVTLAMFRPEQIHAFNRAWYVRVMGRNRDWEESYCHQLADRLSETILRQPHLHRLAASPLLLTLIVQVGTPGSNRAELYQQAVNLLLARWENRIVLDIEPGDDIHEEEVLWLGVSTGELRDVLAQLAYQAHRQQAKDQPQGEQVAEIDSGRLKLALVEKFGTKEQAEQIMVYIQHRAGLLLAQDSDIYTFPHRTFQEFLAASYLVAQSNGIQLLKVHIQETTAWWREVFLLAAGLVIRTPGSFPPLINELLPFAPLDIPLTPDVVGWVTVAAQALVETNFGYHVQQEKTPGAFAAIYRRVRAWLKTVMVAAALLPARARAEAGTWLAQLGDDRPGVGVKADTGLPDILWGGEVLPGRYTIGDAKPQYSDEKSREVKIDKPYRLARYPITHAQFDCFLKADDRDDECWWEGLPPEEQTFGDPAFPAANQPRETVSWYQAIAFCRWLNDKLGNTQTGEEIDLPTEEEWEVAARWPDYRFYPWGNTFDKERANTDEGNVGQTTAVGIYPSGQNSALELYDLSGNVWEWCRNKYKQPEEIGIDQSGDSRVVRGGSWFLNRDFARAAYRFNGIPGACYDNFGFRVVLVEGGGSSPISS